MLAGTEFERQLAAQMGMVEQYWDPFPSPPPNTKTNLKRNRSVEDVPAAPVAEKQPNEYRKRKHQSSNTPTVPTLGRLKMQELLQREQEKIKAKDETPYPTPIEETAQSLLLKTFQRQQQFHMKMQRPRTVPSLAADFLHSRTEVENMVMNYFYLYLDLMEGHEELELDRHQLARLTKLDTEGGEVVDASALCRDRFPRLQEMCDRGIPTNSFMWVKVPLDLNLLLPGEFHNVSVLETNRPRTIECTTTVYHFGQRILETKEIQCPTAHGPPSSHHIKDSFNDAHTQPYHHAYATRSSSRRGSYQSACLSGAGSEDRTNNIGTLPLNKRNLYHFDFVKRFFSTFLAGLHCFEMEVEKRIAVDNLSVMQVFEDISPAFDLPHSQNPPLLCVCYQFECGKGDAKSHFIKNR